MSRWFLILVFLASCASTHAVVKGPSPGIYDVATGSELSPEDLADRVRSAKYVIVAESHDSAEDHALQLKVFRLMAAERKVALGMEMFQRPFQTALDQYVLGIIDERTMLEKTEWESRWGFETEMYAPLWQFARETSSPIVALNARKELTKRVAAVGIEGLSDDERADVVDLDLSRQDYRLWLRDIFAGHGVVMDDVKFSRFYEAQIVWDETMADTAVKFMATHPEDLAILIVVGRGHVERRWGIPSRIERRDPSNRPLVILRPAEPITIAEAKNLQIADILVVP